VAVLRDGGATSPPRGTSTSSRPAGSRRAAGAAAMRQGHPPP